MQGRIKLRLAHHRLPPAKNGLDHARAQQHPARALMLATHAHSIEPKDGGQLRHGCGPARHQRQHGRLHARHEALGRTAMLGQGGNLVSRGGELGGHVIGQHVAVHPPRRIEGGIETRLPCEPARIVAQEGGHDTILEDRACGRGVSHSTTIANGRVLPHVRCVCSRS